VHAHVTDAGRQKVSYWTIAGLVCYGAASFVPAVNPLGNYPMLPLGAIVLVVLFGLAARRERSNAQGDGVQAK
jgi:hypothetical protein